MILPSKSSTFAIDPIEPLLMLLETVSWITLALEALKHAVKIIYVAIRAIEPALVLLVHTFGGSFLFRLFFFEIIDDLGLLGNSMLESRQARKDVLRRSKRIRCTGSRGIVFGCW